MNRTVSVRLALAFSCLVFLLFAARIIKSCSDPGDPFDNFSFHPDIPLEKYAAGRLGLVQPTFARSYLVVAYRYASGVPLTPDEQFAASALWAERIRSYSGSYANQSTEEADSQPKPNPYLRESSDATKVWSDARAQVLAAPAPQINQTQSAGDYVNYLNCSNDALENAATTLQDRVKKFGKEHSGVKAWVTAQDAVFSNCGGDPQKPVLPPPPDASLPEIFRFDREYQIAAAYMYSTHFDEAEQRFQQIAAEKNSPWREIAPYLVARDMVRRATLEVQPPPASAGPYAPRPAFDPGKMEKAAAYLRDLAAKSKGSRYEAQLQALLDRAEFRLRPTEQQFHLSQSLRKPAPDGRFYHWLWDYTMLLDQRTDSVQINYYEPTRSNPGTFKEATPDRSKDDLTDWILTFQLDDGAATQHALEVWRAHRDSLPWLLAVLSKAESKSPFAAEVLAAADRIPANSPAYITAFYHRMRLRNGTRNHKEVRQAIDALLAAPGDLPNYAKGEILDLRLDAAGDLDDAMRVMSQNPCDPQRGDSNCANNLAPHSEQYLDALSLDVLATAVRHPALADETRKRIARNVWLRAVLLGRFDVAQSLDSFMQDLPLFPGNPTKETVDAWIKQFESATTPDEKRFAAIFLVQHQFGPGYSIGSNDSWCAQVSAFPDDAATGYVKPAPPALPGPAILTEDQRKQATAERDTLDHVDSQANYYVKVVLDFAGAHPDDPRVPEALSRAVKNTRMNCNNPRTGTLSKKAFDLLHQRYPATSWAKSTKYWY